MEKAAGGDSAAGLQTPEIFTLSVAYGVITPWRSQGSPSMLKLEADVNAPKA